MATVAASLSACDAQLPFTSSSAVTWNGGSISMQAYQDRLKLQEFLDRKTATTTPPPATSPQGKAEELQRQDRVAEDMADELLMEAEDQRRHIMPSDSDVAKLFDVTKSSYQPTSGAATFDNYLELYGYTEDTFRTELKHRLAEQKLENALAAQRVASALADLKAGKDFGAVAKTWSDDEGTAVNGGQAHFSPQALQVMDPNVRPGLDGLQPGQQSTQAARGTNGYYLFKVISRDANGVTFLVVQVTAPVIEAYRKSGRPQWFRDYISKLEKDAGVKYHVGSHA